MNDAVCRSLGTLVRVVTPGHFEAMGVHLISGRDFSWQDSSNSEPIVIINETAARRHWPGESPIGRLARRLGKNAARVRIALGGTPAQVQFAGIARTLRLAFVETAIGTVASVVAAKGMTSLLFKTELTDHNTFLAMLVLLLAVAGLAGYLSALRAMRIDPMTALCCE